MSVNAAGGPPALPQTAESGSLCVRLDCRHYRGDRPCAQGCVGGCAHYEPMGRRILIIKLGALGDVIRTEALLPGLKSRYPSSQITWVSRANGCRMLANNPWIDRCLVFDAETLCHLRWERFHLVINLDKEPGPAALAMQVQADDRRGIGLSRQGTTYPLNPEAHYYFALGLSNDLKFHENRSSYQRLIYEAVGLDYQGQRYAVFPGAANHAAARAALHRAGVDPHRRLVGLNTGAGDAIAHKTWPAGKFVSLARNLQGRGDCRVVLLGGPQEADRNAWIARQVGGEIVDPGCHHGELDFAALIKRCAVVLSGDTTAMHLAIAQRVPVVVLFGPTCPQEIDLYGRGVKLVSTIGCAPCYRRHCELSPTCMDLITVKQAEHALVRWLEGAPSLADTGCPPEQQAPVAAAAPGRPSDVVACPGPAHVTD